MAEFFETLWYRVVGFFDSINILASVVDILLVAFLVYTLFKFVRDSRAEQLLKGIALLIVIQMVATLFELQTLSYIMTLLFDNGLILLAVIFQPELRRALEQAGHARRFSETLGRFGLSDTDSARDELMQRSIDAVCDAAVVLQQQKMGALLVFERETNLSDIVKSGTVLNADVSSELIGNIFFNKAPLHDGAVLLREGRVFAAGCILPLTDNHNLSSDLGTRHRAAVGMSETSDAVVVVVADSAAVVVSGAGAGRVMGATFLAST